MEKVRPWYGQPSDRGRLKNRTEQNLASPNPLATPLFRAVRKNRPEIILRRRHIHSYRHADRLIASLIDT